MSNDNKSVGLVSVTETEEQELARLRQENAALKAQKSIGHGCKITEKGGMSVYGLGRFPITLYATQWEAFFERLDTIKQFFGENKHLMSVKAKGVVEGNVKIA